jgi:hypothetical protein
MQRPWSDLAIVPTPPALLGLLSLVTIVAQPLDEQSRPLHQARQEDQNRYRELADLQRRASLYLEHFDRQAQRARFELRISLGEICQTIQHHLYSIALSDQIRWPWLQIHSVKQYVLLKRIH